MLKSLELTGFKSFAKKSSLTFNASITSIVGPNGSGKSNVAEAFRFVLGEQSIKSLRGKRGEDLIWNGGEETAKANRASVRLVLDNSKRFFEKIDFDEVSIERVVHRDGINEYYLNGTQVRLRDITELLSQAGVAHSGHHIISQGEADRILNASPKEKRKIIEDALGLSAYKWKKDESLKKLDKTKENMDKVESLRREIAPHIKFLKKQVDKVEKAEEMRNELGALSKEYFAHEDFRLRKNIELLKHNMKEPERELAILDNGLKKLENTVNVHKGKNNIALEAISIQNKLQDIRYEKDKLHRELGKLEGEIEIISKSIANEKEKGKRGDTQTIYVKEVEEIVMALESLDILDNTKNLLRKAIDIVKNFIAKRRTEANTVLIDEYAREVYKLEALRRDTELKIKKLAEDEIISNDKREEIQKTVEREKDATRDAEREIFKIIARQNEIRNIISSNINKIGVLEQEYEMLKRDMGEIGIMIGREAVTFERLSDHTFKEKSNVEIQDMKRIIEKTKIRIEDAGLGGSAELLREYKETTERDLFLGREIDDLIRARDELMKIIADLDLRMDFEFKSGLLKINEQFQKFFSIMFGGGKAEISVSNEPMRKRKDDESLSMEDVNSDAMETELGEERGDNVGGLEIGVSLPRKKIKNLMMLSGGERALTSIALLFAISQVNPPPFVILDETDAALDEANSRRYGDMIEDLSQHSELILITHNRETMSRAGTLYGVTMGNDGASRLLSVTFEEALKTAK